MGEDRASLLIRRLIRTDVNGRDWARLKVKGNNICYYERQNQSILGLFEWLSLQKVELSVVTFGKMRKNSLKSQS
jgi:hypothetical protein